MLLAAGLLFAATARPAASTECPEQQRTPQVLTNPKLCAELEPIVRRPRSLPLNEYQAKLGTYLQNFCHRDLKSGWNVDKRIRDTGPYVASLRGAWSANYYGTHPPVLVWYSPDMFAWLKSNRPEHGPKVETPLPDGAMIIKEMYSPPAAACGSIPWQRLRPTEQGAAVMIRDSQASHDGWFWGWVGWKDWQPDWPNRAATNAYPWSGFGQYCTNCHSSAANNQTFSVLKNIAGEPGEPLVYLTQRFFLDSSWQGQHARIAESALDSSVYRDTKYNPAFARTYGKKLGRLDRRSIVNMPSETYDNVWAKGGPLTVASQFLTSDQCIGCHTAGGTGLQYDMTEPGPDDRLINNSPYGTWKGSPMGLAGRDPFFFAQLASETETFHPTASKQIEDTCFGCHGILGQRQAAIDRRLSGKDCGTFSRSTVDAVPYPPDDPVSRLANYGALARDGVSCTACHRMVLGNDAAAKHGHEPQNACVLERQEALNPGLTGLAKSFTGSFLVGPPDKLYGPFQEPKKIPMQRAIGSDPAHSSHILSSEVCGSCHTVHLPILHRGKTIGHTYEQTTYPEWAFSDYRTGTTPDGALPHGRGARAQSCQDCHMPSKSADGSPFRSKIASIQEYSTFPQTEQTLPPADIDLPVRSGVSKHTLVGLNIFLVKIARQFAEILGIRPGDPMLGDIGINPTAHAEAAILEQAQHKTATVSVDQVRIENSALSARVSITNKAGHKFPSGVAFRRAFVEFQVLDTDNNVLWSSGRTNDQGVIVDAKGAPISGEVWWDEDCSARVQPDARIHQPHYQVITREDQAQIYEELISAPAEAGTPVCGPGAKPSGPLTTSFLSGCTKVKDNRMLPHGFLKLKERIEISRAIGADARMAEESGVTAVGNDADYDTGGGDSLVYRVAMSQLAKPPAAVKATLYYQATPPYFLQDRVCTSNSVDTQRMLYMTGRLELNGTPAQDWKLRLVDSGPVAVP
jgi:mono/diheme cytochrome c family protein